MHIKRNNLLFSRLGYHSSLGVNQRGMYREGAMTAGSSDDFDHFRQAIHPCSCSHDGPLAHHHLAPSTKGYLVFLMISLMIIPLMIIAFSYGYTFVVSQQHRKEIRELGDIPRMATIKREMKGTRTLAIVVTICLFSIIPLLVVTCLRFFGVPPKRKYAKFIVFDLARGLNAICNPVIYGWRNKEFRRAFRKLAKCSKQSRNSYPSIRQDEVFQKNQCSF